MQSSPQLNAGGNSNRGIFAEDVFYLADSIQLHKYQAFAFISIRNIPKDNKTVANGSYANVCFMINGPLKMPLCRGFFIIIFHTLMWLLSNMLLKSHLFIADFQVYSKAVLSNKILGSSNPRQ